jgi:hypothetical protein
MAARDLLSCSKQCCTPADRQQTSTRPSSTTGTELLPGIRRESALQVHMSLDVARVNVNELSSGGLQKSVNACQSKVNSEVVKCPNIFRQSS